MKVTQTSERRATPRPQAQVYKESKCRHKWTKSWSITLLKYIATCSKCEEVKLTKKEVRK